MKQAAFILNFTLVCQPLYLKFQFLSSVNQCMISWIFLSKGIFVAFWLFYPVIVMQTD